jgi:hypothetical protein
MARALRHALIAYLTLLVSLALVNLVRALGMLELLVRVFFFSFLSFFGAPKLGTRALLTSLCWYHLLWLFFFFCSWHAGVARLFFFSFLGGAGLVAKAFVPLLLLMVLIHVMQTNLGERKRRFSGHCGRLVCGDLGMRDELSSSTRLLHPIYIYILEKHINIYI